MVGFEGVDRHHCSVKLSGANERAEGDLLPSLAVKYSGVNISGTTFRGLWVPQYEPKPDGQWHRNR